jgi:hypothetical protein
MRCSLVGIKLNVVLPALVAQTGTGGAVCKGATPSAEQLEADGALAPV